jgi:hypothetical protein
MKLSLTFLALAVATVQADLSDNWKIGLPTVESTDPNEYTFTYILGDVADQDNRKVTVKEGDCTDDIVSVTGAVLVSPNNVITGLTSVYTTPTAVVVVTMDNEQAAEDTGMFTIDNTDGGGVIEFCVRYSLYEGNDEVNYVESIVSLDVTMDGAFAVTGVTVSEKTKVTKSETQTYAVSAALCSSNTAFLQGSLICVQVSPDVPGDVVVSGITDFTWDNGQLTQIAIDATVGQSLSSYTTGTATFDTILLAAFYEAGLAVSGTGAATLAFASRRLGNGRAIQEIDAADAVQDFSIVVDIVKSDDAPTALQTAGGATVSFVVTIVGLVGAVLLA